MAQPEKLILPKISSNSPLSGENMPNVPQEHNDCQSNGAQLSMPSTDSPRSLSKSRDKNANNRSKRVKHRMTPFERQYTELGNKLIPEKKRIDFILIHKVDYREETVSSSEEVSRHSALRERFEAACQAEGLLIQKDMIGEFVYTKLHCPFKRLCCEAELLKLEMPLKGCEIYPDDNDYWSCCRNIYERLETDTTLDFVSAPFLMDKIELYDGYEDPSNFWRPALRCLLTHRILINIDIDKKESSPEKKGLPFMLLHGIYCDSYILHDESVKDPIDKEMLKKVKHQDGRESNPKDSDPEKNDSGDQMSNNDGCENSLKLEFDPRKELDETWTKFTKFQPMWKIRDYFGEKIALYFAWTGTLTYSLWIPTIFGICIFFYGIYSSSQIATVRNTTGPAVVVVVQDALVVLKKSFDNEVTPFFALLICIWGTVFLEIWKRKTASLAYEWDVDTYEDNEPDRPQFYGTKLKPDPITKELTWFYPIKIQFIKLFGSASTLIFMIFIVFVSVAAVIVYRVILRVDYCPSASTAACIFTTIVLSSLLNGISILILGKVYDYLALKLTQWENHRTQTAFDDALIIKLFAFQFANSYSSCFYIAFFRGSVTGENGILGLGSTYVDKCPDDNCMAELSIQILVLMLLKPFPKFLKDIIVPFLKKLWMRRPTWCFGCRRRKRVEESEVDKDVRKPFHEYLERERLKPPLADFTLGEYTEKVIQYGYLMLFAASFPLAPLLALLTNLIDIRVDAKRLLWLNRRPVAFIAQDIGMWYEILVFMNLCGVVSNAFLIAFTSSWGLTFSMVDRLWLIIGFEHIVFALKFILDYVIPDVPKAVTLAIRRERYQISKMLNVSRKLDYLDLVNLMPADKTRKGRSTKHNRDIIEDE